MERVEDLGRAGRLTRGGPLVSGERVHRHDLDVVAERFRPRGEPVGERPPAPALDHVQEPGVFRPLPSTYTPKPEEPIKGCGGLTHQHPHSHRAVYLTAPLITPLMTHFWAKTYTMSTGAIAIR